MAMTKKLWTLNGIAMEVNRDRRTVGRALSDIPPDGNLHNQKAWFLTTALRALERNQRVGGESHDPFVDLVLGRLDTRRRVRGEAPVFTVEEIAEVSGVGPDAVLRWMRGGMPFLRKGNWKTGKGFAIPMGWAMDWQLLILSYSLHSGREDLREKLGIPA